MTDQQPDIIGLLTDVHYITLTGCPEGWEHQHYVWATLTRPDRRSELYLVPDTLGLNKLKTNRLFTTPSGAYIGREDASIVAVTLPFLALPMLQEGQSMEAVKLFYYPENICFNIHGQG